MELTQSQPILLGYECIINLGGGYMGTPRWNVNIVVEDDVWIGYDALILPGVTIGRGAVIGARSVVTKDVPPYCVYAGTKVVKKTVFG